MSTKKSLGQRKGFSSCRLLTVIGVLTVFWLFFFPDQRLPKEETYLKPSRGTLVIDRARPQSNDQTVTVIAQQQNNVSSKRQTTIVSAFFDLAKIGQKTKHEPRFYLQTGRDGTLSFDTPLVFFTDSPDEVRAVHDQYAPKTAQIHIVAINLTDFDVVKQHLERVTKLVEKDFEARTAGYSGLLFMIYHAKPEMMRIAAELNPFNTEKFLWMDVGCVRDWGGIVASELRGTQFPAPSLEQYLGRDGKIMMGNVAGQRGPCEKHVRWVQADGDRKAIDPPNGKLKDPLETKAQPYNWWIAGAIWGGRGSEMARYESEYRLALKRYLEKELEDYSLIDQYLMGALACSSDLVEVVRPPEPCCVDRVNRKWFFLLMFFTEKPYPNQPYEPGENGFSQPPPGCQYCEKK